MTSSCIWVFIKDYISSTINLMPNISKKLRKLKSYELIYIGLIVSIALLILCIIMNPVGLRANDGLSFFGGKGWTIIPYSLAFAFYALCMWLASDRINSTNSTAAYLKTMLRIMSLLLVGLTITPHTIVDPIHTTFGTTLFIFQLISSGWLVYKNGKNLVVYLLILTMLISGIFSAYYLPLKLGYLLQTQIIYQIAFAGILIIYLKNINKEK